MQNLWPKGAVVQESLLWAKAKRQEGGSKDRKRAGRFLGPVCRVVGLHDALPLRGRAGLSRRLPWLGRGGGLAAWLWLLMGPGRAVPGRAGAGAGAWRVARGLPLLPGVWWRCLGAWVV